MEYETQEFPQNVPVLMVAVVILESTRTDEGRLCK